MKVKSLKTAQGGVFALDASERSIFSYFFDVITPQLAAKYFDKIIMPRGQVEGKMRWVLAKYQFMRCRHWANAIINLYFFFELSN